MITIDEDLVRAVRAEFIKAGFHPAQAAEAVDIARHAASEAMETIIRISSYASNSTVGQNASLLALNLLGIVRKQAHETIDQAGQAGTLSVYTVEL